MLGSGNHSLVVSDAARAGGAGSTGAADAVDPVLDAARRQVVVDHVAHTLHVA